MVSKSDEVFLLYYPLKQGLKRIDCFLLLHFLQWFLLYYPLKQGLKPRENRVCSPCNPWFLLYYPLKQGLKLKIEGKSFTMFYGFYSTIH